MPPKKPAMCTCTCTCMLCTIHFTVFPCSEVKDPHLISLITKLTGLLLQIEVHVHVLHSCYNVHDMHVYEQATPICSFPVHMYMYMYINKEPSCVYTCYYSLPGFVRVSQFPTSEHTLTVCRRDILLH